MAEKIVMLDFHRKHIKTKLLRAFEFILLEDYFLELKMKLGVY